MTPLAAELGCPDSDLSSLGFHEDPISYPLSYPGRIPDHSCLLVGKCLLRMRFDGAWYVIDAWSHPGDEGAWLPLGSALGGLDETPLADRVPILAIGSNGSPAQIRRKFARHLRRVVVPMASVIAHGIVPGVSAHVSKPGYVPATPVLQDGTQSKLSVLFLDDEQLSVMDSTELNYYRAEVPPRVLITPRHDDAIEDCHQYVSKHGCLVDRQEEVRRLVGQEDLLTSLLEESPELARLIGADDPAGFIARAQRDRKVRDRVRRFWRDDDLVADQPELIARRIL